MMGFHGHQQFFTLHLKSIIKKKLKVNIFMLPAIYWLNRFFYEIRPYWPAYFRGNGRLHQIKMNGVE